MFTVCVLRCVCICGGFLSSSWEVQASFSPPIVRSICRPFSIISLVFCSSRLHCTTPQRCSRSLQTLSNTAYRECISQFDGKAEFSPAFSVIWSFTFSFAGLVLKKHLLSLSIVLLNICVNAPINDTFDQFNVSLLNKSINFFQKKKKKLYSPHFFQISFFFFFL